MEKLKKSEIMKFCPLVFSMAMIGVTIAFACNSSKLFSLVKANSTYTLNLTSSNGASAATSSSSTERTVSALTELDNSLTIGYVYAIKATNSVCKMSYNGYSASQYYNKTAITNIQSITLSYYTSDEYINSSDSFSVFFGSISKGQSASLSISNLDSSGTSQSSTYSVSGGDFSSGYSYFSIYNETFTSLYIQSITITYFCTDSNGETSSTSTSTDTYSSIDTNSEREAFMTSNSYTVASSYEDAQLRSAHGLSSGSNQSSQIITNTTTSSNYKSGSSFKRNTTSQYTFRNDGSYESYTILNGDGSVYETIYYGGAYTEINEVASYLLAFEEVPPNMGYYKNNKSTSDPAISNWWRAGRVNYGVFSGPLESNYTYEPAFPGMALYSGNNGTATRTYVECDFGDWSNYNNASYVTSQGVYSDGSSSINRGVLRFVFTAKYSSTSSANSNGYSISTNTNSLNSNYSGAENINNRYVFYTYDHYGDFQEYLNYADGWGQRFGSMEAGNSTPTGTTYSPTAYPTTVSWAI